jgi:HTH-type transcriptional regulator / antitoxin HigA
MKIGIIRTKKEYEAAMARLSALMEKDPPAGSPAGDEMELLALVIGEYERRTVPLAEADPIEAIRFRMEQMGLSRRELVPFIGSIPKVSEVLARKRPLSLSMIRRLHRGLDIPAEVLISGDQPAPEVACREPRAKYGGRS